MENEPQTTTQKMNIEAEKKEELKVFCYSIHTPSIKNMVNPSIFGKGKFILSYSIDGVNQAILSNVTSNCPQGTNFNIEIHGMTLAKNIVDKISEKDLDNLIGRTDRPVVEMKMPELRTPDMKKDQYIVNLKLFADQFANKEDVKPLCAIISRAEKS